MKIRFLNEIIEITGNSNTKINVITAGWNKRKSNKIQIIESETTNLLKVSLLHKHETIGYKIEFFEQINNNWI